MSDYFDELKIAIWFFKQYPECSHFGFPSAGKTDYAAILKETHRYLNTHVHGLVEVRARLVEPQTFLTDHGPDHIKMVMQQAQSLVVKENESLGTNTLSCSQYIPCLSAYEVFLLLMAIHFHDVGNEYGREGHEKRITDVMAKVPQLQELDRFEQGLIARIATCHGGTVEGDRNTISRLPASQPGASEKVRPQLIAAVLRLADELADDRSRAGGYAGLKPVELPQTSQIFHRYAAALASVKVDSINQQIRMYFQLSHKDTTQTYPLGGNHLYLLDYIYQRTLKTYREMVYCSKFMRDIDCQLWQVTVEVEALCDEVSFAPVKTISYRIGDIGYPDDKHGTLESLAPGFADAPDGEALTQLLNEKCVHAAAKNP
jgi:hypothetical protein